MTDEKKVCKTCGKATIKMTDAFKYINPEYVGSCLTCMFPITKNEIVTRKEYIRLSKISDQIGGDGE